MWHSFFFFGALNAVEIEDFGIFILHWPPTAGPKDPFNGCAV
jgi:hypothetical protein